MTNSTASSACIYTGHFHLKEFLDVLCDAGLEYRWIIACVNDDTMGAIRSNASILTFWRPVLLFQKRGGRAKSPRILRDLILSKRREKTTHEWQQPLDEAVLFVKTLSEPNPALGYSWISSSASYSTTARSWSEPKRSSP